MSKQSLPRGVRNNNPYNLRLTKDPWQGRADAKAQQSDTEFFVFTSAAWGIRAGVRTWITYQDKYNINTIRAAVERHAPDNENDTQAYIRLVCKLTGYGPDEILNFSDYGTAFKLAKAIIRVENGQQPYADDVIIEGLKLAGVKTAPRIPMKTAVTAATAASAQVIVDQVPQVKQAVETLNVPWLTAAITIIGVCATVYLVIHSMRRKAVES